MKLGDLRFEYKYKIEYKYDFWNHNIVHWASSSTEQQQGDLFQHRFCWEHEWLKILKPNTDTLYYVSYVPDIKLSIVNAFIVIGISFAFWATRKTFCYINYLAVIYMYSPNQKKNWYWKKSSQRTHLRCLKRVSGVSNGFKMM